ncbi:hypothetical protein FB645_004262 [Coemansia sp. IMI 203386]|nr:hypothetical protein FB645_004262 [Coemansia sp. IMI 203386]
MASLEQLITDLTTTGLETLDPEKLKLLKTKCKTDTTGDTIIAVFQHIFKALNKSHAQIRLSSLQVINELFVRSHVFRSLFITQKLPEFLLLAFGAYGKELPLPKSYAIKLQQLAARYFYEWVEKYGFAYQRLVYAFRYLRYVEKIDFRAAAKAYKSLDPARARCRREMHDKNRNGYMKWSFYSVQMDMRKRKGEIVGVVRTMERCFGILVPDIAGLFDEHDGGADGADYDDDEILAVMAANRHAISVDINPENVLETRETEQNKVVYEMLRDCLRSCTKIYQPRIKTWLDKLGRIEPNVDANVSETLSAAKEVESRIADAVAKCQDLGIDVKCVDNVKNASSESEDEFEDVTEETAAEANRRLRSRKGRRNDSGHSGTVANTSSNKSSYPTKRNEVFSLLDDSRVKADPTYIDSRRLQELRRSIAPLPQADVSPSNPIEDRLREIAPVVAFDTDLLYWGEDYIPADTSGFEIRHRFLGAARDRPTISGQALDRLHMRAVPYESLVSQQQTGAAERPIIKACRAPLKNGKLCTRRDLVKCPFHGLVIPRDEQGHPAGGFVQEDRPSAKQSEASEGQTAHVSTVATAQKPSDLSWQDLDTLQRSKEEREKQQQQQRRQQRGSKRKEAPQSALVKINKKQTRTRDRLTRALRKHAK